MTELELKTILDSIKELKTLCTAQNPMLPMLGALGGAIIGGLGTFLSNYRINQVKNKDDKNSTTLQIYSEIKATIEIATHRNYIGELETITSKLEKKIIPSLTYQVQISDDRFPVFKSNLPRMGLLDIDLQVKIVEFYQTLDALVQDVKPGGILNATPVGLKEFSEALRLSKKANQLGSEIIELIEKRYNISKPKND